MSKKVVSTVDALPNLKTRVEVEGVEYTLTPAKVVEIDRSNLEEEFASLPKDLAQWAMLEARLNVELQRLDYARKKLWAHLDYDTRGALESAGVKITEKKVEHTVVTHADYQEHMNTILDYSQSHRMVAAGVRALEAKKEMLISLGAHSRAFEIGPRVRGGGEEDRKETAKKVIEESRKKKKKLKKKSSLYREDV